MSLSFSQKKVGIWGFGVSGKATLQYLLTHWPDANITVLDKKLNQEDVKSYTNSACTFITETPEALNTFLENNEIIIPSPGIDLRPYKKYAKKMCAELDLFYEFWNKPCIAITGTLGKTSITHLLDTIMRQNGKSVITGGNIGTGMTALIDNPAACALLELSSFQLEHAQRFAPDCAIITNLYPNHLDRHGSMEDYWRAKRNVLLRQKKSDVAIVPLALAELLRNEELEPSKKILERPFVFTHATTPTKKELKFLRSGDYIFYCDDNGAIVMLNGEPKSQAQSIVPADLIPPLSYAVNWVIIAAFYHMLGADAAKVFGNLKDLSLPEYRLEEVATINTVTYYNDSKSTIINATIAATQMLQKKHASNIVLILGGTSKGVDRLADLKNLKEYVTHILCFGAEAQELAAACKKAKITHTATTTLEDAVASAQQHATSHGAVLLSPGGASFDLFKDYKERGEKFKQLVLKL